MRAEGVRRPQWQPLPGPSRSFSLHGTRKGARPGSEKPSQGGGWIEPEPHPQPLLPHGVMRLQDGRKVCAEIEQIKLRMASSPSMMRPVLAIPRPELLRPNSLPATCTPNRRP